MPCVTMINLNIIKKNLFLFHLHTLRQLSNLTTFQLHLATLTLWKKGCFAIGLKDTCNSLYLYVVSVNKQVAWITKLQLTIYTVQPIATQLQLSQNNSFSTTMQLCYNCTHDVMLTSLIVIHLLKFDMWYYEDFWTFFFQNIDFHHPLYLLMMVQNSDMWHNKKLLHNILIAFWNIYSN
jgi:hypothetical protein